MADSEITVLAKANTKSNSLRTTVPAGIARQFELKEGDELAWKMEAREGDIIVTVEPHKK